jgi:hypothetical protein
MSVSAVTFFAPLELLITALPVLLPPFGVVLSTLVMDAKNMLLGCGKTPAAPPSSSAAAHGSWERRRFVIMFETGSKPALMAAAAAAAGEMEFPALKKTFESFRRGFKPCSMHASRHKKGEHSSCTRDLFFWPLLLERKSRIAGVDLLPSLVGRDGTSAASMLPSDVPCWLQVGPKSGLRPFLPPFY